METCLPCSNYTGGASLLSLLRGIVLPLILLCFIYSQRLAQQSSVSLHGILCQPHSSLRKLVLENEPGPSVRCRVRSWKVRVLCSYFRGEAKQKQMQEKEEWEQKQEKATDHSQRLRAKKITGCFYIPKPWPLSLQPEMSNLYWKLVWPFTFTRVRMWIMNVDTLPTDYNKAGVAGKQETEVSRKCWSGFIIHYNKNCKDSRAHDHMLQLRPGKEAGLVQQYLPGCSEAGTRSQSSLDCHSLHGRVFFLKSRSLCGTLHRPSMSWGKSSWTRLINKRNESRWKESTGPSRNWSMQSPRMWASLPSATGRRALINSQGWPAEAPWPTYRQAKDRAGLLLLNSKPWQPGPSLTSLLGPFCWLPWRQHRDYGKRHTGLSLPTQGPNSNCRILSGF